MSKNQELDNKEINISIEKQIRVLIVLVYCLIFTAIFIIIPLWLRFII